MIKTVLLALISHWRRRPVQGITLLIGLALATALWSGVQAINAEARASYDAAAGVLGQDQMAALTSDQPLPVATYVKLRRAGWQVAPVIAGDLRAGPRRVQVLGIDVLSMPPSVSMPPVASEDIGEFNTTGFAFAHPDTRKALSGVSDLPRIVANDDIAPGMLVMDIGIAARLLNKPDILDRLLILPNQSANLPPLETIAPELTQTPPAAGTDVARLTDSFHLNLTAFGFLSFAVGLFIVHGTIGLAFEQRRAMFRTLRALGVPLTTLLGLLTVELLIIALIGGALGVVAGYFIAAALLPGVAATLSGLYGASVGGGLSLRPEWWATGIALTVIGTVAAAAQAMWRVYRLPVLAPAQPRAWAMASRQGMLWQLGIAAALAIIGIGSALFASGLVAAFTTLGALLIAAALALPAVLSAALALGARLSKGPIAGWFWADTRQQIPGLSLALMALLLALSANVGVGTMVSSFRLTFTGYLDQRLASELYLTAKTEAEGAAFRDWMGARSERYLPIWNTETRVAGRPAEIYGVVNDITYRDAWPMLEAESDVWDRIADGGTALINEQLWRRTGLNLGDPLILGPDWQVTVIGVYSDYGNPLGQVVIRHADLLAVDPDIPRLRHGIRAAPEDVPALMAAITAELGIPPEQMIDQAAIKTFSLEVFERTFTVTDALNILTLAVAGFALLTAFLTLASMRLPQVAPVWALGLTRAELGRLELLRAVLLALITMAASIPVGLLLAYLLLAFVNVEAFGWRLPMFLFPLDWIKLTVLAILAALLAAALPIRTLARTPPARLLKVFADER